MHATLLSYAVFLKLFLSRVFSKFHLFFIIFDLLLLDLGI